MRAGIYGKAVQSMLGNIGGRIPIFIANFVINRKFSVRIGNTLSEIYDQEEGVPQGIILVVTVLLQ